MSKMDKTDKALMVASIVMLLVLALVYYILLTRETSIDCGKYETNADSSNYVPIPKKCRRN